MSQDLAFSFDHSAIEAMLIERMIAGEKIIQHKINNPSSLKAAQKVFELWDQKNSELLQAFLCSEEYVDIYNSKQITYIPNFELSSYESLKYHLLAVLENKIASLEMIYQSLNNIDLDCVYDFTDHEKLVAELKFIDDLPGIYLE